MIMIKNRNENCPSKVKSSSVMAGYLWYWRKMYLAYIYVDQFIILKIIKSSNKCASVQMQFQVIKKALFSTCLHNLHIKQHVKHRIYWFFLSFNNSFDKFWHEQVQGMLTSWSTYVNDDRHSIELIESNYNF